MGDEAVDSGLYAPAVERALGILEHLARHPSGLTLSDLSAQLELPKNAVFRITNTLRERGYLARDGRTMRFTLTEKLVRGSQPRAEKKGLIPAYGHRRGTGIQLIPGDSAAAQKTLARSVWKYAVVGTVLFAVTHFLLMAPSSALAAVLMFYALRYATRSDRTAMWLALLYAFGTPVFFRTGFLNHNVMLGHIAFAGFLAIWNPGGTCATSSP